MERLRKLVSEIAYTRVEHLKTLSIPHKSLLPLLFFSSSLFRLSLFLRSRFYSFGFFPTHRLPVPVISVGNLTWGGNGKTPMVEFIARYFTDFGISPLIITRGYAGGDEARMLQRHLTGTSAKIGVGANRSAVAASFLERYGYVNCCNTSKFTSFCTDNKLAGISTSKEISAIILDDGMQHWSLSRDLQIVMINGLMPWGNGQLIPLGPLREPLTALERADVAVIHHSDLLSETELGLLESTLHAINRSLPIFFSRMSPSFFFEVQNCDSVLPLKIVFNMVLLCVSAIGCASAFVQGIIKMGPLHVDRLDFTDHHRFTDKDIEIIEERIGKLRDKFGVKPIVVATEKDFDRDPVFLKRLHRVKVLVICSLLQIMPSPVGESHGLCCLQQRLWPEMKDKMGC